MRFEKTARLALLLSPLLAGCVDVGATPRTGVYGRVTVGNGVIFLERGHVHEGTFERFAVIGEDGRFEMDLPVGGPWGVHLYYDDYFYLPMEVDVREDFMTPIEQPAIAWGTVRRGKSWTYSGIQPPDLGLLAPIPDDNPEDNPQVENLSVVRVAPGRFQVSADIFDPEEDMSVQALIGNATTGDGLALGAPGPATPAGYWPNGTWTLTMGLPEEVGLGGSWYFVAADFLCSNSPVIEVQAVDAAADAPPE